MSTKNNQTSLTPGSKEYLEALAESQGEIKQLSPFNSWVLQSRKREEALEWAQKHPKRDKFRHFIPVINSWWTSTKADPAYPSQRKAVAQAIVSDAIALTGLGKIAQAAGIAPAITTEALTSAGAYGGNELGEHLVEKYNAPWWTPMVTTAAGGALVGSLGYKSGTFISRDIFPQESVEKGLSSSTRVKPSSQNYNSQGPLRSYVRYNMSSGSPNSYETHLYDVLTGDDLGHISTTVKGNSPSKVKHIVSSKPNSGIGRDLYSSELLNNNQGVISGERLLVPEKTTATWKHFELEPWGKYGQHGNNISDGQVVRLLAPESYLPEIEPKIIALERTPVRGIKSKGSFTLYERPSKITTAEKLGLPKSIRRSLTQDQLDALDDVHQYITSGRHRSHLFYDANKDAFVRAGSVHSGVPAHKALLDHGAVPGRTVLSSTSLNTVGGNYHMWPGRQGQPAVFTGGKFVKPDGMGWAPGDLTINLADNSGKHLRVIMTAPRTDYTKSVVEGFDHVFARKLPNTIDKNIMRTFWKNNDEMILPGSYLSGDTAGLPIGHSAISAIDEGFGNTHAINTVVFNKGYSTPHATGLSPDSYSSIIRQGGRPGHSLRWGQGFTDLNNSAVNNAHIYSAYSDFLNKRITAQQLKTIFDDWSIPQGGRPLEIQTVGGEEKVIFPHPYIYYKQHGGKFNNENTNKNS